MAPKARTIEDIKELIERLGPKYADANGCWLWPRSRDRKGYGQISFNNRTTSVTRLVLSIYKNFDLSSKMDACHACDNPPCFNPEHLFAGTRSQNIRDSFHKGRKVIDGWVKNRREFTAACEFIKS